MATLPQLLEEDIHIVDGALQEFLRQTSATAALVIDKGGFLVTHQGEAGDIDFTTLAALASGAFMATQTIAGTFTLSPDDLTVTFTITGTPDGNAKKSTATAKIIFVPSPALADLAGDAAAGSYTMPTAITWF